jgi:PAS domain S-box-containing protein
VTAIVVAGLIGSSIGVYRSVRGSIVTSQEVTHTYQVIDTLDTLLRLLVDAETGQRGYVLSQREEFLEPYRRALPGIGPTLDRLAQLTADNPRQQARLPELRQSTANRIELLAVSVRELVRTTPDPAQAIPPNDKGKRLMDQARGLIAGMREEETTLLAARTANWRSSARRQAWLTISFLALVAISLAGSAVFAARDARARRIAADAHARLAAIVDSTNDSVVSIDAGNRIASWNRGATRIYGFTAAEMIGREVIPGVEEQGADDVLPGLLDRVRAGERVTNVEAVRIRKDRTPVHVSMSVSPLRDSADGLVGFAVIARDISERVQAEEELDRYREELERSNRDLQDFAAVASHDLQEPLRKITAFGDLLAGQAGATLDAEGRDYLDRITAAAIRMRALIEGLLVLARVTTQAGPFQATDLAAVAAEVLVDLDQQIRDAGGRVELGSLPVVQADALQMRQLFQNLIGNALKFHRPGVPPIVSVEVSLAGAAGWTIRVADNGIGFDEKYLDRIFRPFQRLHARNEFEGSGIGLAICDKIVARHGGTLTARSTPGQGTTFIATLTGRRRG